MGVQPATLQTGLVAAEKSTDISAPVSIIVAPIGGTVVQPDTPITIAGTTADVGGGVIGAVEVSTDGGNTWKPATGRASWSYVWTPSTLGQATIRVRAVDDSGNLEAPGASVTISVGSGGDTTAPAVPAGLTATGAGSGNTLTWTANTEPDLAGYNVYRSGAATGPFAKLNTALVTTTSFSDANAPVGTSYYRLTAVDATGNESAQTASVSAIRPDTVAPAIPSGLTATGAAGGNTLAWTANTEPDLAGYNVYRSAATTGPFTKLNAALVTAATFNDTAAPVGTSYYRVTAVDATGNESAQTASVSAVRPDASPPAVPTGLTATGAASGNTLTWSANTEPDLAGYNVYRSAAAAGPFTKLNAAVVTATAYTDTTAPVGTSYYRLTAVDATGNESGQTASVPAVRPDTTAPAVPTGLTAAGAGGGNTLTWTANAEPDLAGYNVYRSTASTGPFAKINAALVVGASYLDTSAPVGVSYYRITAVDASGNESAQTASVSATRPDYDPARGRDRHHRGRDIVGGDDILGGKR